MEQYSAIFIIAAIVVVAIQIALIVKFWIMADDVKRIANKYHPTIAEINILLLKGEKEKAIERVKDLFYIDLYRLVEKSTNSMYPNEDYKKGYNEIVEEYKDFLFNSIDFSKYDTLKKTGSGLMDIYLP